MRIIYRPVRLSQLPVYIWTDTKSIFIDDTIYGVHINPNVSRGRTRMLYLYEPLHRKVSMWMCQFCTYRMSTRIPQIISPYALYNMPSSLLVSTQKTLSDKSPINDPRWSSSIFYIFDRRISWPSVFLLYRPVQVLAWWYILDEGTFLRRLDDAVHIRLYIYYNTIVPHVYYLRVRENINASSPFNHIRCNCICVMFRLTWSIVEMCIKGQMLKRISTSCEDT